MAKRNSGDLHQRTESKKLGLVALSDAKGTAAGPDLPSVIIFSAGGVMFGVDVNATEGVVDCPRVVPLPHPPRGVIGLTSVRGRITIVLCLARGSVRGEKQRLILLRGEAQLGLLTDRIESVVGLEPDRVIDPERNRPKAGEQAKGDDAGGWPVTVRIKLNGKEVPVIDVERLSGF
ncbi:MAG TPA: chemotaxis protein CheW [Blastocatellia bacterium]|nr:chemotaxis protein CheW [Blastocatellia bacterium]